MKKNLLFLILSTLFWSLSVFGQAVNLYVTGAGAPIVNGHYTYQGYSTVPFWGADGNWWQNDNGVVLGAVNAGGTIELAFFSTGGDWVYFAAGFADINSPESVIGDNYQTWGAGSAPYPAISTGSTGAGAGYWPTNNVYILGGTNSSIIINDGSRPVPVTIMATSSQDHWASAAAGMGFGLTVCGFGWVLRIFRRLAGPDNS